MQNVPRVKYLTTMHRRVNSIAVREDLHQPVHVMPVAEVEQEVSAQQEEVQREHAEVHSTRSLHSEVRKMKENSERQNGIAKSLPDFMARRKKHHRRDQKQMKMVQRA